MQTKSFNIVIYPSQEIIDQAIKVSRQLKKRGGLFVLDNKNYFPHISIYMMELPIKNLSRVKQKLKEALSRLKYFKMFSLGYRQNKDGYVDANFRKTVQVKAMQLKIIKALNSLREGHVRRRFLEKLLNYKKSEQKNIKLYGYRSVGNDYYPHLTFSCLRNSQTKALKVMKSLDFSFTASQIGLFELGEHGTCTKKVEIFKLKNT